MLSQQLELAIAQAAVAAEPVFRARRWRLAGCTAEDMVPDVGYLIKFLTSLAEEVVRDDICSISSGRFLLRRNEDWDVEIFLRLGGSLDHE